MRRFKRFIARRGVPNLVVSDNGSTFKSEELKKLLAEHNIDWKFNVALAPWWGGFFERLVRSTKLCLKKTLGTARVSFEELLSVVEIEGIINSRPLMYVDDELRNPLTPSQLIIGRRLLSSERKTGGPSSTAPQTGSELSKRAKYLTTVLSQFWRRWQKEYSTELRVHHNCQSKNRQPTVEIGDVVCIHKCYGTDFKITATARSWFQSALFRQEVYLQSSQSRVINAYKTALFMLKAKVN